MKKIYLFILLFCIGTIYSCKKQDALIESNINNASVSHFYEPTELVTNNMNPNRVITISFTSDIPEEWKSPLSKAIDDWNDLNLKLSFDFEHKKEGDIIVGTKKNYMELGELAEWSNGEPVKFSPPRDGNPSKFIFFDLEYINNKFEGTKLLYHYIIYYLKHSLSHAIGIRHVKNQPISHCDQGLGFWSQFIPDPTDSEYSSISPTHIEGSLLEPQEESLFSQCPTASTFSLEDQQAVKKLYGKEAKVLSITPLDIAFQTIKLQNPQINKFRFLITFDKTIKGLQKRNLGLNIGFTQSGQKSTLSFKDLSENSVKLTLKKKTQTKDPFAGSLEWEATVEIIGRPTTVELFFMNDIGINERILPFSDNGHYYRIKYNLSRITMPHLTVSRSPIGTKAALIKAWYPDNVGLIEIRDKNLNIIHTEIIPNPQISEDGLLFHGKNQNTGQDLPIGDYYWIAYSRTGAWPARVGLLSIENQDL